MKVKSYTPIYEVFDNLEDGQIFEYAHSYYIKVFGATGYNAVNLESGELDGIALSSMVIPLSSITLGGRTDD